MKRTQAHAGHNQKLYRSIREVSQLLEVKPHVLRYWETQFPSLHPRKNRAGNRIYRPEEIDLLGRIKELLYGRRFTIEGARRLLHEERRQNAAARMALASVPTAGPSSGPSPASDAESARLAAIQAGRRARIAKVRDELLRLARELRDSPVTASLAEAHSISSAIDGDGRASTLAADEPLPVAVAAVADPVEAVIVGAAFER